MRTGGRERPVGSRWLLEVKLAALQQYLKERNIRPLLGPRQGIRKWRCLVLPTKAALSKLLAVLYDAAGDTSLWSVFLRELALATNSNQAGILLHDLNHGEHT